MNMSTSPPENEGLARELDVMWQSYQRARDDLFGAHLTAIIKRVSPVAVDALAAEGLRVDEVVDRFRPPTDWPEMPLRLHDTFRPLRFSSLAKSPRRGRSEERRFARRHLAGAGCVIRDAIEGASGLGVRLTGNGIEVAILTDDYLLTTAAGKGRLQVTGAFPLTIGGAMLGRPVGDFVDHPLLNGRDYPVRGVTQMVGEGTTLIVFDTGSRRYARR